MAKSDWVIGGLLVFSVLAAYLLMLCPTVYWEDSGELISAAHSLGIPHPPGHPLWVILGRVFSILPFGATAYKVNLLSAFFSALTGLACYFTVLLLLGGAASCSGCSLRRAADHPARQISAVTASLALCFSGTVWFYSEIAEVYALLGFFCSLLVLLALLWRLGRRPAFLVGFAFMYGLALTNNVILLALLPAFLYLLIDRRLLQALNHPTMEPSNYRTIQRPHDRTMKPSNYMIVGLAFLLGLSLYVYLPLRSRFDPFVDWGNPETLGNLLGVVSAREFTPQFFSLSLMTAGGPLKGLAGFFVELPRQYGYLGFALGIVGLVALLRWERSLVSFLIGGILLNVVFAVFAGGGPDLAAYYIPSYVLFALFVGAGSFDLLRRLRRRVALLLLPLCALLLSVLVHIDQNNQRVSWGALKYSKDLGRVIAPNGVLLTDNTVDCFLLWYLQAVEEESPGELAIYTPLLSQGWYRDELTLEGLQSPEGGSLLDFARSVSSSRPVYYTPGEHWLIDPEHLSPHGLVFRFGGAIDLEGHSALLDSFDYRGFGGQKAKKHYAIAHSHLGEFFYRRGNIREAISAYRRAAQIEPGNAGVFYNLGILRERAGDRLGALESYQRAIELGYREESLLLNVGVLHLKSGNAREAIPWLRSSLAKRETAKARYTLGACYLGLGDIEEAIGQTKRAIALDPRFPDAYNNLGICYYHIGEYGRAGQQFQKALELDPHHAQARHNLELLGERREGE